MDLYDRYKRDLSNDASGIDYCVSFIKNFRTLKESFVKDTLWHDLWLAAPLLSDLDLTKAVIKLSTSLDKDNSAYGKYTTGIAYER